MRISTNQRRILRWIAHGKVWSTRLDLPGYGNRRRVVRSLSNAGLIMPDPVSGILRLTEVGKRIHAENCRHHAEETGFPFKEVL